jgi:choline-sulfatase
MAVALCSGTVLLSHPGLAAGAEKQEAATREAPACLPNVLFIMTDQQRWDTIHALGNTTIYTPNLDRLARRGVAFLNAYSQCPVCVPARYTIRTGCESRTTRIFQNAAPSLLPGEPKEMTNRCGPYLAMTLSKLGYRTFGIGKFHTHPRWDEPLGYDVQLHGEEMYGTADQRRRDAYGAWIAREHPKFDYLEGLVGERTEMYYEPQRSPMPAALTIESWAADQAVRLIQTRDGRPYFGLVSFVGPHPPLAPPIPFNRMYDPDRMPNPVRGDPATDHMDEQIPWMNYAVWAEAVSDPQARILKARYYGEISYIDACMGRILDAVEARGDGSNTLICFFSDHGDLLGDHDGWQKECYFEGACHIPFLVSWPVRIPPGQQRSELVCLTDLFGIATRAAGKTQLREGADVLGMIEGTAAPRKCLFAYYGSPGTRQFKIMVRHEDWKYVFLANGGRQQLFNLRDDPHETNNLAIVRADVSDELRDQAAAFCSRPELEAALEDGKLRGLSFQARRFQRVYQFDHSRGVFGFPERPEDVLKGQNSSVTP